MVSVGARARDGVAGDVLHGAEPRRWQRRIGWRVALGGGVAALLAAGLLQLGGGLPGTSRPAPVVPTARGGSAAARTSPLPGARAVVSLTTAVATSNSLVQPLDLVVLLAPLRGPGLDAPRDEKAVLELSVVQVRGFDIGLATGTLPQALGAPASFGAAFSLRLRAVVSDCSVSRFEPRRLDVVLRRGNGAPTAVPAETSPGVVSALDQLAERTCRRNPAGPPA